MWWSISEAKRFRRCQRQWYYKNIVANARARDPIRQEAHRLAQLQSLQAWRGSLVDETITRVVIPALQKKRKVTLDEAKRFATQLFDRQIAYARNHRTNNADGSGKNAGDDFAALHPFEYGEAISEQAIEVARSEVFTALSNLFRLDDIKAPLRNASKLIAQRSLAFSHSEVSVRAVPDLIAFYNDEAPLIVDWKVHAFGLQEAWLQLAIYVLALCRCNPHSDFPRLTEPFKEQQVRILEVQLLGNEVREYHLEEDDFLRAEAYIAESATQILLLRDEGNFESLRAEDFLVTSYPETCESCPFRRLCWEVQA
jgi:hypothetical protein